MNKEDIMQLDSEDLKLNIAGLKGFACIQTFGNVWEESDDLVWAIRIRDEKFPNCETFREVRCPDWPNSIVDAMELLEELRKKFFMTQIICWDHNNEWYFCGDYRQGHEEVIPRLQVTGNSLPSVICRAWLMANLP